MRVVGFALIAAALLVEPAFAYDPQSDLFWISPALKIRKDGWPKDASGKLIYGEVKLDCAIGAKRAATDCTIKSQTPTDPKIAEAALKLAPLFKARPDSSGRSVLDVDMTFDTPPDWLKKPTFDEMMAVYPAAAGGGEGSANIYCIVQTDGLLRSCQILREKPASWGFGGAAVALAQTFLMKPAMREGHPVESTVDIPIAFGGGLTSATTFTVLTAPIWARTPTIPEILSELDKKVGDRFADGKVVFQCSVTKKTGLLSDCILANASPGMIEFRGAARSLTSKFQIAPETLADKKNDIRVNLAFSFPDMTSVVWSGRYLSRTHWTRVPSADPNRKTFPDEAAKAGLKEGMATVDCVVAADGGLTHCKTVSESTPGVGFGPVAEQIAQVFATNPWTDDGLPAEGAHVQLPIKMVDADADKPDPGAAPAPTAKP